MRQIAKEYLGDPNLWDTILHFNNIYDLSELSDGTALKIPIGLIEKTKNNLSKTKEQILLATENGANIFAKEELESSIHNIISAQEFIQNNNWIDAYSKLDTALEQAQKAFAQARDMRNKMADATVSERTGDVEKRRVSTTTWRDAPLFTNLYEKDHARTLSASQAEISFQDLSKFRLGENSQAVVQKSRIDLLKEETSSSVKLIQGEAFAKLIKEPKENFTLEIPGLSTKINSKLFWVEKEEAQSKVANYDGEIELTAKNKMVIVKRNEGSVVPNDGVPSAPTTLLAPPKLASPFNNMCFYDSHFSFTWEHVIEANEYWLQITKDPSGDEIIQTFKTIITNKLNCPNLSEGIYYWRVASVDKNGLPGKYSNPFSFFIVNDDTPPFLVVPSPINNIITNNDHILVEGSTEAECQLKINNEHISLYNEEFSYEHKLSIGKNLIAIVATDNAGNATIIKRFVYYDPERKLYLNIINSHYIDNNYILATNNNYVLLQGNTSPQTFISIINKNSNNIHKALSDSTGYFSMTIPVYSELTGLKLVLTNSAGNTEKYDLSIHKDTIPPLITLNNSFSKMTKSKTLTIRGNISEAETLTLNDKELSISDNSFSVSINLTEGNNPIILSAKDQAGNETIINKDVFVDSVPPEINDYQIKQISNSSDYEISVTVKDQSDIKQTAVVYLQTDHATVKMLLEKENNKSGYYSGVFHNSSISGTPVIKRIIVQDYLNNTNDIQLN